MPVAEQAHKKRSQEQVSKKLEVQRRRRTAD